MRVGNRRQPGTRLSRRRQIQWADSVLGSLTLRDKAAQLVWAVSLGDYVPNDSRAWRQVSSWIDQGVGGFIISVGSPLEIAAKLNRMQSLSRVPLIFSADYETGAGMRVRGGYFVPNAIDLGGATVFPPEMAMGATGDPNLAYAQGKMTAIEGRAVGVHIDFTPVLDVNNNPDNPVINTRSYGRGPSRSRDSEKRSGPRNPGQRDDRNREALSGSWRHRNQPTLALQS